MTEWRNDFSEPFLFIPNVAAQVKLVLGYIAGVGASDCKEIGTETNRNIPFELI